MFNIMSYEAGIQFPKLKFIPYFLFDTILWESVSSLIRSAKSIHFLRRFLRCQIFSSVDLPNIVWGPPPLLEHISVFDSILLGQRRLVLVA